MGKHGLIPDAGATDQSQTDGVGGSGGASIKLQNISQTHTHTHTYTHTYQHTQAHRTTYTPSGNNKSTCLFHLCDSVAIYMPVLLRTANNTTTITLFVTHRQPHTQIHLYCVPLYIRIYAFLYLLFFVFTKPQASKSVTYHT